MPFAGPSSARFVTYTFLEDWAELIVAVNELEIRLRRVGRPAAAAMLVRAYTDMRAELRELARVMAARGTAILRETEARTRVRPDTAGAGGPRLGDHLIAEAIDQEIMPGSIGIADEAFLDGHVPWWLTNEIGSSGRVGGQIFGFFSGHGEDSPPDQEMFREHPIFQPGRSENSGKGIIKRPIPARRFIEKAAPVIEAEWQAGFQQIKARFDAALTRIEFEPA